MPSNIIPLESIQIATPCHADWNAMQRVQGNGCIRFCQSCGKNVYDLSGFTRDDAMRLIEAKEGHLCLRLHRRSDGTVITSDCPIGEAAHKHKYANQMRVAFSGIGATLLGVGCLLLNRWLAPSSEVAVIHNPIEFSHSKKSEEFFPFKRLPQVTIPLIIRPTSTPSPNNQIRVDMGDPLPPSLETPPSNS